MRSLLTRHSNNTAITAIKLVTIRVGKKQKVIFNNLNYLFFSSLDIEDIYKFSYGYMSCLKRLALIWQNYEELLVVELPLSSF